MLACSLRTRNRYALQVDKSINEPLRFRYALPFPILKTGRSQSQQIRLLSDSFAISSWSELSVFGFTILGRIFRLRSVIPED